MDKFVFKDKNGIEFEVYCYVQGSRWGYKHVARAEYKGGFYQTSITYQGRTWERFKYESTLYQLAKKIAGKDGDNLNAFNASIEAKAKAVHEECEAWINAFKKDYDALSDSTKKVLADSDIVVETQEQAEAVMKGAKTLDIIKDLL